MNQDVRAAIREVIQANPRLRQAGEVGDTTPLATHGILDSVAVLELVLFLETRFGIEFTMKDLDRRRLETIEQIEALVREKLAQKDARKDEGGKA